VDKLQMEIELLNFVQRFSMQLSWQRLISLDW